MHLFFGNLSANANSTYESLRTSGESTCTNELNRSAYWMPALLDGRGNVIRPNYAAIYYKRRPSSDPWFKTNGNIPRDLPRGLRYVFGNPDAEALVHFKCVNGWKVIGTPGTMTHALQQCAAGQKLLVSISSPKCWDGKNLDSPDHRSHMAYMQRNGGQTFCPDTHPFVLPMFTLTAEFSIELGDVPGLWRFSSDMPGAEPGSSFHSDWFGAWEDSILDRWHRGCIDKMLNCSDGDFGDGGAMKKNAHFPSGLAVPRLVPVPANQIGP
ncbi:DUF1996 domain-containing protein [Altererythrobacter salegens]|uniref:DUF1996 domain-containing protein n=1 Tax=Croceibacterium salegens TaxID=1737568 RepID=A0A6I4T0G9_9SPHN|nr:DUF1996 domain-containing protein [Croceibacterium salegens]